MNRTTRTDISKTIAYKPRIINTTDLGADPDDEQSMVRFLVSSNEFDVEGLIVVTSCWKQKQKTTAMLDKIVDAYGEVLSNLEVHADGYPSLEYLKSISKMGQKAYGMDDVGEGKDSPGSELIIAAVDKPDPRPVWVTFWGGGNTLAQALWKVKNSRSSEEVAEFVSKLRIYDVLGQDDAATWIVKTFPELFYIRAKNQVYGIGGGGNKNLVSETWIESNIQSHGPLGACYADTKYAMEGDTPAYLHLYPNGLNDPEKVDQGGWGGRFNPVKKAGVRGMDGNDDILKGAEEKYDPYYVYTDAAEGGKAISRWRKAYQNDFAARMDWTITGNYSEANHHPIAVVNGDDSKKIIQIKAQAGSNISLCAAGSSDPDGDALSYQWYYYDEPSSYNGSVTIQSSRSESATVQVPSDAAGKNIHVILEICDNGSPNLYAFRRVIINVQ